MNQNNDLATTLVNEETALLDNGVNQNYGTEGSSYPSLSSSETSTVAEDSRIAASEHKPDIRSVLTRRLVMVFINQMFLTFLDMSHFVLLPLMYSTSIPLGGLGLDPFQIGVTLGAFGCVNSIIQAKFLGRFIRKCGARKVYIISFSSLFFCFFMYPFTSYFAKRAGRVDAFVIACMIVQLAFQTMIYMAYGELSAFTNLLPSS